MFWTIVLLAKSKARSSLNELYLGSYVDVQSRSSLSEIKTFTPKCLVVTMSVVALEKVHFILGHFMGLVEVYSPKRDDLISCHVVLVGLVKQDKRKKSKWQEQVEARRGLYFVPSNI